VWLAGKRIGMSGQSVWERLRSLGYPMISNADWTSEELEELRKLAGQCTIGEIGTRLGRPYAGVACKISELKLGNRYGNKLKRKTIRGYPKKRVLQLINQLESYGGSIRSFCREHSLDLEHLIWCIQRWDRPFWDDYTRRKSDLTSKVCPYCNTTYYPLSKKQRTCSRQCSSRFRNDRDYFGGKRRDAIGLAEGVCQLCMVQKSRLAAHHVLGKENDEENDFLIALCPGCHQLVGMLANRNFAENEQGWENLINLVLSRRLADRNKHGETAFVGVHTCVDLEWLTQDDLVNLGEIEDPESAAV
jgi:5-methylcytosine-specific restriction endonuclease McrA